MSDRASSAAHTLAEAPGRIEDRVESGTQGNPLAAGAVAFGVGLLAGSLTPVTRAETQVADQLSGPVVEPIQEELGAMGQDVAQAAQEHAKEAVSATTESARTAAQDLQGQAAESAQQVRDDARQAGSDVADQTRAAARQARDDASQAVPPDR